MPGSVITCQLNDTVADTGTVQDLVITDLTMPNMSGLELASEIIRLRPGMPFILCTGYSENITPAAAEAAGVNAFMLKPVSRDDLIRTTRKVLDASKKKSDDSIDSGHLQGI